MVGLKLNLSLVALGALLALLQTSTAQSFNAPTEFNTAGMANNKTAAITCCEGARTAMENAPDDGDRVCSDRPQTLDGNAVCHQPPCTKALKVVQFNYCAPVRNGNAEKFKHAFDDICQRSGGKTVVPTDGACNFSNYNRPVDWVDPDRPVNPGPGLSADPKDPNKAVNPGTGANGGGTAGGADLPTPARPGAYRYALVDFAMTRALTCCDGADEAHKTYTDYTCKVQGPSYAEAFSRQCHQMFAAFKAGSLGSSTGQVALQKRRTDDDDDDDGHAGLDATSKSMCSTALTNAKTYTYGHCRLAFDEAAVRLQEDFEKACKSFKGRVREPKLGSCMWNVEEPVADQS